MVDYASALPVKGDAADGATVDASRGGILVQGNDGSNYQDIAVNSSGHVLVDIQDASVTVDFTAEFTDDAAYTVASDTGLAIGGVATSDTVDSGDFGVLRINTDRELYTSADIRNVGGNAVSTGSGAVDSGTLRVVLPTDQSVLSVDDNGGSLTVDATQLDIDNLNSTDDEVGIGDGTNSLVVNADGSLNITDNSGSLTVDASQLDIDDLNSTDDEVGIGDGTNSLVVNADGSLNVVTNSGAPTFVYASANLVQSTQTEVNSYSPASGSDHLLSVEASGSGLMKVELFFGTTSSEALFDVKFNSTANPNVEFNLRDLDIASTQSILVKCTNLEEAGSPASDFSGYVTIWYRD